MKFQFEVKVLFLTIGVKVQALDTNFTDGDVAVGFQVRLAWR